MEKSMELAQISGRMTLKTRLKALQVRGLMMVTTAALMAAPALATGQNTDSGTGNTMQTIIGNVSYIKAVFEDLFDLITDNPLFVFYIALGILSSCVGLFWRMKRAARR